MWIGLDGGTRRPRIPAGLAAEIVALPPRGPYSARNSAALRSKGPVILFTDSDCVCPPDWVATARRLFADPGLQALQGSSEAVGGRRLSRSIQFVYESYVASHAASGYRAFCNTRNFGIRREIFERLPFREDYRRGGDGMHGRRLADEGIRLRYEPGWMVRHTHPASRVVFGRQMYRQGRDGVGWQRTAGVDLFGGGVSTGPGAWLRRRAASSRHAARIASAALAGIAGALAVVTAFLPYEAGRRTFLRFARAAHLAGRLRGEAAP